jgi:hypothetical protein
VRVQTLVCLVTLRSQSVARCLQPRF